MEKTLSRVLTGLLTLTIVAFALSWFLPESESPEAPAESERLVTMDLTQPDSQPQESSTPDDENAPPADSMDAVIERPDVLRPSVAPEADSSADKPTDAANSELAPSTVVPPVTDSAKAGADSSLAAPPAAPGTPLKSAKPAEPAAKPAQKAAPKSQSAPKAKAAIKPKPDPRPAAKAAAKPGAAASFEVQAGAYSHLDKAESVRRQAQALGVTCAIAPTEAATGTLYRLRCGPYASRAQADAAAKKLSARKIPIQVVGGGR